MDLQGSKEGQNLRKQFGRKENLLERKNISTVDVSETLY